MQKELKTESKEVKKSTKPWWKRILIILFILFICLPLTLSLILHIPYVQNWAIDTIASSVSERIEETVKIDNVDFSVFNGLELNGFDVITVDNDTIIGIQSLNVTLGRNLFSLINNELEISTVTLNKANIKVINSIDAPGTNIERIISLLSNPKSNKKKKKKKEVLKLKLNQFDIYNIDLSYIDKIKGSKYELESKALYLFVNQVNLDSNSVNISDLSLKDMNLSIWTNLGEQEITFANAPKSRGDSIKQNRPWSYILENIVIQNGNLKVDNNKPQNIGNYFDPNNFMANDLTLVATDLQYLNGNISTNINSLSFNDNKGFSLEQFVSTNSEFTDKKLSLPDLQIQTNNSYIKSNIKLNYRNKDDLKQIMNKTILNAKFSSSEIAIKDLMHFIPKLNDLPFFKNNKSKNISLAGIFTGRLANLKGKNVNLNIPGIVTANGNFGTRNLDSKNPLINLRMQSLNTSIAKIKKVIPNFQPPENFNKLGDIKFTGNFDGYLTDFVAYGTIKSDLGTIKTDMRLDLKQGVSNATYSGDIALNKFNLRAWSDNDEFGYITFTGKIRNGKGLTVNNAYADLEGSLDDFDFRGYLYNNININGAIDKSKFDGKLSSSDLNFNFGFDGFAELVDNKINFDFVAEIGIIDFKKIKLSDDEFSLKGKLDFKGSGSNLNDLIGNVEARNLKVVRGDSTIVFDSLLVKSYFSNYDKVINIVSDGSSIDLEGQFKFETIINDFKSILKNNYPYHTRAWDYASKPISKDQNVSFDIKLRENKPLFSLLKLPTSISADTLFAKGELVSESEEITLVTSIPKLEIKENVFNNVFLSLDSKSDNGAIEVHVRNSRVSNKNINQFNINAIVSGDNITFGIETNTIFDSIQNFDLSGTMTPFGKGGYSFTLDDNNIKIFNKRWKINSDNVISLDRNYINIDNFSITDGSRLIKVSDIENKGLIFTVNKFDVKLLNQFLKDDRLAFTGDVFANLRIADIFKKSPDLYGNVLMPDLRINNDKYGEVNIDLSKPLNKPLDAIVSINNAENGQAIKANATINLDNNTIDADVKGKNIPLKILQYLLYKGVENVEGYADLSGTIDGTFDNLKINSEGITKDASVRVLVLGETYTFGGQKFKITESRIDMDGAVLTDSKGGLGFVSGGINHTLFKDLYLDASLQGDNVVALNTTKYDNPNYYGLGIGNVLATFTGNVNYPNISINAKTNFGTKISIPIESTQSSSAKSFITFIDKEKYFDDSESDDSKTVKIDGVSLEMNLVMTPAAEVFLIFDESKGDIIEATGSGNMQINMNRNGDFDIFGEYDIRQGKYLFTAFSFVNKPFIVREGGKVRWNGDPINATLDLKADYKVRTDLSIFLSEYLVTPTLEQAAANTTDVNLQMIIGNTLFNPTINFGLNFPDLSGDLKSYADSKVRLLKTNQNDLNSQVFGLLVFNSFLPSNTLSEVIVSGNYLQSASVNTLSEFVSNQLSSYVTRFLNESLEENGLISGIDFDINLRNNLSVQGVQASDFSVVPTEIEVKLKNEFRFLDGRLSFDIGGNFVRESLVGLSNYVVPEFVFRYALTKDRKLNLKVYGKYDLDEISVQSRRQRLGVGLRYRTEFGSMLETKSVIRKSIIKTPNEQN